MTDDERLIAGRYRLREPLGRGGMADVHVGHDETLNRDVAVKLLRSRYVEDDTFLERFRREARSAARLNHRNIVSVHDTGDDDGVPFIVMELVPGRSLDHVLEERGALPVESAVRIMVEVCGALAYAHAEGVVHRDVKPGNILVIEDGDEPSVKVADFGIARAAGDDTITLTSVMGTAAYLSPEQARGERADHRADLYSAGIVLYELLTGAPPYRDGTAVQVALRHVGARPDPPSEHAAGVSEDLDAVVLTALAKEPRDRYQSAERLQRDLEAVLAGEAVSVDPAAALAGAAGLAGGQDTLRFPDETLAMEPGEAVDRAGAAGAGAVGAGVVGPGAVGTAAADGGSSSPDTDRSRRWVAFGALAALLAFAVLALLASGDGGAPTDPVTPTAPAVETTAPTSPTPPPDEAEDEDEDGNEDGDDAGGGDGDRGPPPGRGRGRGNGGD